MDFVGQYAFEGSVLEDKDLSGIACVSSTRCLIGADEGREVQVVELNRSAKVLRVLETVPLLQSGAEIDLEGIAAEGDTYYIIGSHGVAKKSGWRQDNRYKIIRLKVDRVSGMPVKAPDAVRVASLSAILEADATLGRYFRRPLQRKGVNIEGLAVRDGRLFVGFRNPNLSGYAFVMEIAADDVFASRDRPEYRLHKLKLGAGLGIREIVAVRSCFLLIAGNAGSEPSEEYPDAEDYVEDRGYAMFRWDGPGAEAQRIAPIPNVPGKAEAMAVLEEADDGVTVLVLFDGAKKGRPSVYRIH